MTLCAAPLSSSAGKRERRTNTSLKSVTTPGGRSWRRTGHRPPPPARGVRQRSGTSDGGWSSWQWSFVGRHGVEPVERIAERWAGGKSIVFTSREVTHPPRFSTPRIPCSAMVMSPCQIVSPRRRRPRPRLLRLPPARWRGGTTSSHAGPWGVTTRSASSSPVSCSSPSSDPRYRTGRGRSGGRGVVRRDVGRDERLLLRCHRPHPPGPGGDHRVHRTPAAGGIALTRRAGFLWVGLAAGGLALLGWDSWTGIPRPVGRDLGVGRRRLLDGLHPRFSTRR